MTLREICLPHKLAKTNDVKHPRFSFLKKKKIKSKKTEGGLVSILILKGNKLSLVPIAVPTLATH